jgi:hypothetical protein
MEMKDICLDPRKGPTMHGFEIAFYERGASATIIR